MITIPEKEPLRVFAGDTWQWKRKNLQDYPASSWNLKYYLDSRSPAAQSTIAAVADGDNFSVSLVPATTATYTVSDNKRGGSGYYWVARVEHQSDGRIFTVDHGRLDISLELSAQTVGGYDPRIWAEKALDNLTAVIENRATIDQLSFTIAGRTLQKMDPQQIHAWRNWFAIEVASDSGQGTRKSLKVEFKNRL